MNPQIASQLEDTEQILKALQALVATNPIKQMLASMEELYRLYLRYKRLQDPDRLAQINDDMGAINEFLQTIERIASNSSSATEYFHPELDAVGKNIRTLRISATQDIETVAKAIGIKPKRLELIEDGHCGEIRISLLEKISNHFGTPIHKLLANIPTEKFTDTDSGAQPTGLSSEENKTDLTSTENAAS